MRALFLDCSSGISGDMTVAALIDLGIDPTHLENELAKLGLSHEFHIHVSRQSRQNIAGTKFDVHTSHTHQHGHDHPHSHRHEKSNPQSTIHNPKSAHGRSFSEINDLIASSALSAFITEKSVAVFRRIAAAEGKIHGLPPEDVTFHEVGAMDSIVDIVATCIALEALGVERIHCSALVEGTGFIDCAHGRFPLPAPATLEILAGLALRQIDEPFELITPTGAAIVSEFGAAFGPMPAMTIDRIGYGLGTRDTTPRPNVLRAVLGALAETSTAERDEVVELQTNLDDLTPELAAAAAERLLAAGALDVFLTPIQMKKNRPGFLLTVLSEPANADRLASTILRETTTFGIRTQRKERVKLHRTFRQVATPFGPIRIKLGYLADELIHVIPEFDSCRQAAEASGAPVHTVYRAASLAAQSEPLQPPPPSP
jgi:uncharacterized protein (TIGR00299 family) protein